MFRSKTQFEKMLEKATSNLLLEPDFDSMLQLCDMIRGGDIKAREAVAFMKARIKEEKNPNVCYFALSALDTVMKNCGDAVHEEVITQTYLEELKDMAKTTTADRVKNMILEMVQAWGIAFKEKDEYKIATNLYNVMKAEGYKFPAPTNTTDMFKSERAPVWKDGDECSKCKSEFGIVQRKHHCRACGGLFCNRCTNKQSIIPKFGIEKEVRVCDSCYNEINNKGLAGKSDSSGLPQEYLNSALAKETQNPPSKNEQQLKEEEELQIAIAMSLNEQENSSAAKLGRSPASDQVYSAGSNNIIPQSKVQPSTDSAELDPELARYLNRNLWEKKKSVQEKQKEDSKVNSKAVAKEVAEVTETETPVVVESHASEPKEPQKAEESLQNGALDIEDNEEFLHGLRTSVEIFMNRMKSDQMRNRSIANDSAVQSLFQSINMLHPTLLQQMNDLEERRLQYEALQDKLVQIRDARAALDALREEHKQKLRRAAEEAERLRQIQMAQKLEIMRQKKQEYLAYQRQIALQRLQDQEAARQARLEQQKQFIRQRAMQPAMIVQGYNSQYMPHHPNIGEAPKEPQQMSMAPTGYNPYAQPFHPQAVTQPQHMYHQPQYPMQAMQQSGHFQHDYSAQDPNYQVPVAPDGQMHSMSSAIPQSRDVYNVSNMASALPEQTSVHGSQVVATAPPPTPQPSQQQVAQSMAGSQPQMMAMDDTALHQQHIAHQQPQQVQPSQNLSPLISFD